MPAQPGITKAEADISYGTEMNRSFPFSWNMNARGALEIHSLVTLRGGASFGMEGSLSAAAFAQAGVRIPVPFPVFLNVSYIFNSYPDYKTSIHSVIPNITAALGRLEITLGYCFRTTRFSRNTAIRENSLAYRIRFNLIDTSRGTLTIYGTNFSDFMCGNTGAYKLGLDYMVPVSSRIAVTGGFELLQTGSTGLTSNIYGMAMNGGVRICF